MSASTAAGCPPGVDSGRGWQALSPLPFARPDGSEQRRRSKGKEKSTHKHKKDKHKHKHKKDKVGLGCYPKMADELLPRSPRLALPARLPAAAPLTPPRPTVQEAQAVLP